MDTTSCAVVLDATIRTGTANVLAQRQFSRSLYEGTGDCVCQLKLEAGSHVSDSLEWNFVSIMTNQKLKVTFVDSEGTIITLTVNKFLVLDNKVSSMVIVNEGDSTATISIAKLR